MTKKEEQYIRELGQLYVRTGEYDHVSCGGGFYPKYKPVDVLEYIEQQEYNETLNTYMKFRTAQRYSAQSTCHGIYYDESSNGDYVVDEKGKYINIKVLESKLKPEDIKRKVNELKSLKYKDYQKFSRVPYNGSFAIVEDPEGNYVYDNNVHKFIDITK